MFKMVKKGRNPGAVDSWLESLGLYRKNVAYDETCLFRAVSEQLLDCQIHHERVRKECLAYARENYDHFKDLKSSKQEWLDHLTRLEKHMVVCGNIELHIISKKYEKDIVIFHAAQQKIVDVVNSYRSTPLLLCLLDEDHYDVVYKKEHISITGFCQSIVYKVLYENVFNIPNIDEIVNVMLYDKTSMVTLAEPLNIKTEEDNYASTSKEDDTNIKQPLINAIAPFPFKVAKALDPTIYRNIEYDSWGEVRREMRLGEWYYGDDRLILGTKCIYNASNFERHECYIQEIIKNENKCVVYLMESAQKKTVNYSDLSPEDDAKPWPLPYRFSKNLNISAPTQPPDFKINLKCKKRKDKKRTKSESSIVSGPIHSATSESIDNVNAYIGVPLQMQSVNDVAITPVCTKELSTEPQPEVTVTKEQITLPETPSTPGKYPFETTSQWYNYLPPTPDSYIWSQSGNSPNTFNFKPMIASAPVTPDVVPYHDANYPFYYNYHMDPVTYQNYTQWSSAGMDLHHSTPITEKVEDVKCQTSFVSNAQPENVYVDSNTMLHYQSEYPHHTCERSEPVYEPISTVTVSRPKERPTLMTNLTPSGTSELYSPIIPVPPGTPVMYTTAAAPEMTEVVLPTTPILYTPTVDVQYMSPGPFIYPPTPPAAWYPTGVTSQGFIFPARN